ncbi:aromatic acid exporter family protein [Virgibacillus halophilus]|uniref:aromatic acid exporter family protein n=1 Tax=Tigheibacillus halophilus TaxID=361280 RepID=UPI0036433AC4
MEAFKVQRVHIVGSRVIKTGIAVFLTAWICELLHWPPVFAVITAIVTIEPTAADSIKKGIIRFPASAIGSAYAVIFISLFGSTPLTYMLAAVLTIATCFKLKLHAGLLVATLTAVAMVEVIHSNYFLAFLIRLGTTTTGLLVSTMVNMFILPPDYMKEISQQADKNCKSTANTISHVFQYILRQGENVQVDIQDIENLNQKLRQTETLIQFEKDEVRFHPLLGTKKTVFTDVEKRLHHLRLIHYHLENLVNTPIRKLSWNEQERRIVLKAAEGLAVSIANPDSYHAARHQTQLERLTKLFWEDNEEITRGYENYPTQFPPELIILYELLAIYHQVTRLFENGQNFPD